VIDVSKFFKQKEDDLTKWGFSKELRDEDFRNCLGDTFKKEANVLTKYINSFPNWGRKGLLLQSTGNFAHKPLKKTLIITHNIVKKIYDRGKIKNFILYIDSGIFFTNPFELPEIDVDRGEELLLRKADLVVFQGFSSVKLSTYGTNKLSRILYYFLKNSTPFIMSITDSDTTLEGKLLPESYYLLKKLTRKIEFKDLI